MFQAHADETGKMSFARFMEIALYDPQVGYYRRNRPRIGYGRGTDFFTSTTSGEVFGELVSAACAKLLRGAQRDPAKHVFVELGTEPGRSVLAGVQHPFAGTRTVGVGEPLTLSGDCVVFSNELFDAQPFVRTVRRAGQWLEIQVQLTGDRLVETEAPSTFSEPAAPDGYRIDRPIAAASLAETIGAQAWRGLFVACDYGKSWRELTEACPAGTARAYFQHTQSNDLLARPGEQDLTCHICWDWIAGALARQGFAEPTLEFQETFFVRHAGDYVSAASAADAARFSPRKLALLQLLHPSHLGQKFQVLHAVRQDAS